jgi:hypothetical protein
MFVVLTLVTCAYACAILRVMNVVLLCYKGASRTSTGNYCT